MIIIWCRDLVVGAAARWRRCRAPSRTALSRFGPRHILLLSLKSISLFTIKNNNIKKEIGEMLVEI